jgi:hypothetical protein
VHREVHVVIQDSLKGSTLTSLIRLIIVTININYKQIIKIGSSWKGFIDVAAFILPLGTNEFNTIDLIQQVGTTNGNYIIKIETINSKTISNYKENKLKFTINFRRLFYYLFFTI